MKTLLTVLLIAGSSSLAHAQTTTVQVPEDKRCFLGNMAFTEGVTMRASNQVMVCTKGGAWVNSDLWAAGCLSDGKITSTNQTIRLANHDGMSTKCLADGTWGDPQTTE